MNHLVGSSMTRGSTTQTRTFVYNSAGQLTSATNPENGTVSYTYNSDTTLNNRTDAMGQVTVYTYDPLKRITETQIYPAGLSYGEDVCQRVTYGYDAGTYGLGHLTSTQYGAPPPAYPGYMMTTTCAGTASPYAYQESYTYHPAGAVTGKTLAVTTNVPGWYSSTTQSLSLSYSYDSAGQILTAEYPQTNGNRTYTYGFDGMGRPVSMTDDDPAAYGGAGTAWVQNGQFDAAGRVTSLTVATGPEWGPPCWYCFIAKTASYNVNGQLASLNWSYLPPYTSWYDVGLTYSYSATHNNGQITQMADAISGETVSYSYDALKRLTSASSAPISGSTPAAWTQAFQYDGFGNLTSKVLNGGGNAVPSVNAATNRLATPSYDANGNMLTGVGATLTYDERNRLASASPVLGGTEYYGYAPDNKRIYRWAASGAEEFTLYGARGERVGTFGWQTPGSPQYGFVATETDVWFGGQLIGRMGSAGGMVFRDREGTDREGGARYYPYGDEITSTPNDTEKYGTYFRDSFTTLDYADQRYYASSYGRFNTADPYQASAKGANNPSDPVSWNRYAYAGGDPVNRNDSQGLMWTICSGFEGGDDGSFDASCEDGPGGFFPDLWAPPSQPQQIKCSFDGPQYFGPTSTGVTATTGPYSGQSVPGEFMQMVFGFSVTGALDGPYRWSDTQITTSYGVESFVGGGVHTINTSLTESIGQIPALLGTAVGLAGSTAFFNDNPGLVSPVILQSGQVLQVNSAAVVWNFNLQVTVTGADGRKATCPSVQWQAVEVWQGGQFVGGTAGVVNQP